MDPNFQTSFIPRRPVLPGSMAMAQKPGINILATASTVIFVIVVLLAGGAFFYERSLVASNETKKQEIQAEIASFDPELSAELTVLKARLDAATQLLKNHIALTEFFKLLQQKTVSTIRFTSFTYSGKIGETLAIDLNGEANSFNDLVLQSDAFLASPFLTNTLFSGFTLDELGKVKFMVKANLDPSLVSYQKAHERLGALVPAAPVIAIETVASTTASTTSPTP